MRLSLRRHILKGKRLINIDSEDEGILPPVVPVMIYTANIPIEFENSDNNTLRIEISGLNGGHSGIDIGKQRENAIKLLGKNTFMSYHKIVNFLFAI